MQQCQGFLLNSSSLHFVLISFSMTIRNMPLIFINISVQIHNIPHKEMQIIFEHFKSTKPCFRVVGVFSCRCRSNLFGWVTVFAQSFILQQQKSHKNILLPMSPVTNVTDFERMRIIGKGLNERIRIHPKSE